MKTKKKHGKDDSKHKCVHTQNGQLINTTPPKKNTIRMCSVNIISLCCNLANPTLISTL